MKMNYTIVISALSDEDGGGFLGAVPDLQGCMSDGKTPQEAAENTTQAIADWIECQKELGRKIPEPGTAMKRAMEDRARLVDVIATLSEGYDGFDQRIESMTNQLREIKEMMENDDAWRRFSAITGYVSPKNSDRIGC
jgi:antitoxin HicB